MAAEAALSSRIAVGRTFRSARPGFTPATTPDEISARRAVRVVQRRRLGDGSRPVPAALRRPRRSRDRRVSGRRRWRSAAWRVSWRRSSACSRLAPSPAAFVREFRAARDAAPLRRSCTAGRAAPTWWHSVLILRHMLRTARVDRRASSRQGMTRPRPTSPADSSRSRPARVRVDVRAAYGGAVPVRPGVHYFFPRPSAGSGCKRLNLFLRWMVRRDAVDPGGWTSVRPAQLVVPLDTHIIRVGRCLRLTTRTSPGWKMAAEITAGAACARSRGSGALRLRPVSPRDDEGVRLRHEAGEPTVSAQGILLPSTAGLKPRPPGEGRGTVDCRRARLQPRRRP